MVLTWLIIRLFSFVFACCAYSATCFLRIKDRFNTHGPYDCVILYIPYSYWGRTIYILSGGGVGVLAVASCRSSL